MKKAWDDIKSFVTIAFTVGYIVLTFMGKMTPEYQDLYKLIIIFYFGTQAVQVKQYLQELAQAKEKENVNKEVG